MGADMNAKFTKKGDNSSEGIGPFVFGAPHTAREDKGVEDNRTD